MAINPASNRTSNRAGNRFARPGTRPSVSFVLLCLLLVTILIAGGASMANVSGQLIVRAASWAAIIVAALGGVRPDVRAAPAVFAVLAAMLALVLLQLVPLPPAWWQALPGRAMFADASALTGAPQPWRPARDRTGCRLERGILAGRAVRGVHARRRAPRCRTYMVARPGARPDLAPRRCRVCCSFLALGSTIPLSMTASGKSRARLPTATISRCSSPPAASRHPPGRSSTAGGRAGVCR